MKNKILAQLSDVIEKSTLKAIQARIENLPGEIASGIINIDEFNADIAKKIQFLHDQGYKVYDEENIGDTANGGFASHSLNRSEIRKKRDEAIKENLAKGVRLLVERLALRVQQGNIDPLSGLKPDDIKKIINFGEKYNVIRHDLIQLVEGNTFNSDLLETEIKRAISENLSKGLIAYVSSFVGSIREGDMERVENINKGVQDYVNMCSKNGVSLDSNWLKGELKRQITADNVQAGITLLLKKMRECEQEENFQLATYYAGNAEKMKQLISSNGLSGKVNLTEMDGYLKEKGFIFPQPSVVEL